MISQRVLLTVAIMLGIITLAAAQPTSSASSTGSLGGGGGAPIDGGITLLVGGIAAYGVKKIRDNHKKMKDQSAI